MYDVFFGFPPGFNLNLMPLFKVIKMQYYYHEGQHDSLAAETMKVLFTLSQHSRIQLTPVNHVNHLCLQKNYMAH